MRVLPCLLLTSLLAGPALIAGTDDPQAAAPSTEETIVVQGRTLHPKSGTVIVGEHLATLEIPAGLRFYARDEARYIIEKVCHNPEDPSVIGLVMPDADDAANWMTVISYDPENGHVSDSDAKGLDFDALLKEMQQGARDGNAERKAAGFDTVELRGWAEPPHYDPASHKLYWAKRLKFSSEKAETLNYSVRVLTRRGVLEMNTIDEPAQLAAVATSAQQLLAKTTIADAERYDKFDSSIDKVAVGGIAAVIAGGVLAKSGLLAVIGKFLLAFIKPVLIGGAFVGGWIWKFVAGRRA